MLTSKLVKDGAPLLSRALWLYAPITMEDPASFVGLSFVSCLTGVPPASGPNLAAGLYHGVVKGTALFLLGAVLAALVSVALTRSFLRGLILSKMAAYEEKRIAIEAAIEKEGALMIVILLRLSPAMPLAPANILLGLTTVGIAPLLAGTAMGLLPFTAVYAYVGSVGQQAAEGGSNRTQLAAQIVGILATVALTLKITRVAQKALDGAQAAGAPAGGRRSSRKATSPARRSPGPIDTEAVPREKKLSPVNKKAIGAPLQTSKRAATPPQASAAAAPPIGIARSGDGSALRRRDSMIRSPRQSGKSTNPAAGAAGTRSVAHRAPTSKSKTPPRRSSRSPPTRSVETGEMI